MKTITLTANDESRFWAKVQKTDRCWIWQAALSKGYGSFFAKRDGKEAVFSAHRVAYMLLVGGIPDGYVLDHKCRQPSCVNPDHLRPVTVKQNAEHRGGANANNGSSGVRGVYWHKRLGRWEVRVRHASKTRKYGTYATIEEAESVAVSVRNELYTHNDADRKAVA